MTLPDGTTVCYRYLSTEGGEDIYDGSVSRITELRVGAVTTARYWYNGAGTVVGTIHDQPDVIWEQYGSSGTYPDLDRFNRVTSSRWTKDLGTDVDFYDVDITYDRNSNITVVEDNVHPGFDVSYTMDGMNRLTNAEEGTWGGSSISSTTREQIWTLDQVGNWDHVQLDLDGSGTFTGTDEYDDDRTHNVVNELTGRDVDDDSTDDYTLSYDEVGNLIDDGENYKYEWDAFGRLRNVKNQSNVLVAEYTYNGLNYRIGWHYDVDADGTVEDTSDDPWYYFAYDERWRIVATYRDDDTDPKEQFVYQAAGSNGLGTSSYIDDVILRDKDANTAWASASDGTLEQRIYYCQNWRADVSALVKSSGRMVEWVKYSAYGVPFGLPAGDVDSDGDVNVGDTADTDQIQSWIDAPAYDVRGDLDLDGDVDATDKTAASVSTGTSLGWSALSRASNRKGGRASDYDVILAYTLSHRRGNDSIIVDLGAHLSRRSYENGVNAYELVIDNADYCSSVGPSPSPSAASSRSCDCDCGNISCNGGSAASDIMPSTSPPSSTEMESEEGGLNLARMMHPDQSNRCRCVCWAKRQDMCGSTQWLDDLPNCPCLIPVFGGQPHDPNNFSCEYNPEYCSHGPPWLNPDWTTPAPADQTFHPGATYCMRQNFAGPWYCPSGQQCCYDESGSLITSGRAAGTPDFYSPDLSLLPGCVLLHFLHDVGPHNECLAAGMLALYFKFRPPNNGSGCAENPVNPIATSSQ